MNIIYEAVVGSKLKGNDTPLSDTDTVGIFIARNEDIGGFEWNDSKNVETTASPDGDDETFYEVRKFFRLAAKSTPAILPFIGSNKLICSTPLGEQAIMVARGLISVEWLRKNANYVRGKYTSYLNTGKKKELIEAYYIGELTAHWLWEGRVPSSTLQHSTYFSQVSFDIFMALNEFSKKQVIEYLASRIDSMEAHPFLPLKADLTEATELLKHIRNNIG